jgi:hypothetical protein
LGADNFYCGDDFFSPHAVGSYRGNWLTGSPAFLGVLRDYPVRTILAVYQTHALKEAIMLKTAFITPSRNARKRSLRRNLRIFPALFRFLPLGGLVIFL